MFRQDRTNPSTAVSTWKGRKDLPKANPSTAVSNWMNGNLSGGASAFNAWGGLITQWKGQTSTLADTSGAGNNGTTSGALINADAKLVGSYGLQNTWSDTQNGYSRAATLSAMGATSAFSFSGWSKFTGTATQYDSIVGGGPGSWASGFGIYVSSVTSATNVNVTGWANGYSSYAITKTTLNPQNWNHYALTYDGSTLAFYVNGTQIGTDSSISGAVTSTAPGIGNFNDTSGVYGYSYDGYCDEYGFWSSGLTSAEITAIYNSGTPLDLTSDSGSYVSSDDLVGYYQFNSQNTYNVHTFRGTGKFTVSAGTADVDYLFVAGGGGGGNYDGWNDPGGGGGAGGVTTATGVTVDAASSPYTITVGTGGTGGDSASGANGSNTSAFSATAAVGGGGGGGATAAGNAGGSGGGGRGNESPAAAGGSATAGQGNAGGAGEVEPGSTPYGAGGGGGGKGAVGEAGGSDAAKYGGDGGAGSAGYYGISASTVGYAGGGGGGSDSTASGAQADGGSYGGGKGGFNAGGNYVGGGGVPNTGGGGGGTYGNPNLTPGGGDGGAGIVIIRYAVAS